MRHSIVYREPGMYAGWPANHGAWQWGDEMLFGFMRGKWDVDGNGMHSILEPYEKVQARSLDGGRTWSIETVSVDFHAERTSPAPHFSRGRSIMRVCGSYDTGGEGCAAAGGFYLSDNRGKTWDGAYSFDGLEDLFKKPNWNTSRTCASGDLIFLSIANSHQWGSDSVVAVKHDGSKFRLHGVVCNDQSRAVMPSAARVDDTIFVAMRRKGFGTNWIDAFSSKDGGSTWALAGLVGDTISHNGNPPALVAVGETLYCAYAVRPRHCMMLARSEDLGVTWKHEVMRDGGDLDIGYPQMFANPDGTLVCVYYWADRGGDVQHIAATEIETK